MKVIARFSRLAAVVAFVLGSAAVRAEDPTFGTWSIGSPAPGNLLATHSTLLRNGKILVVGGSSYNCCHQWGREDAWLYDIATGTWSAKVVSPAPYGASQDAFCSGHVHDHLGNVVFQGGLLGYGKKNGFGIPDSARYDVGTGTFTQISGGIEHWYPTLVAGVQHTFNFPGTPDPGGAIESANIQKLAYGGTVWTTVGAAPVTLSTYPRVSLLPDGRFFIASPSLDDLKNKFFHPSSGLITPAGDDMVPETGSKELHAGVSWQGSGALLPLVPADGGYPKVRFALVNGVKNYVKDLAAKTPKWTTLGVRPSELGTPPPTRYYANATLLPTGQLIVTGGVNANGSDHHDAVRNAEVLNPDGDAWLLTSAATVPRNYHGVALLLPDGRVWTAGGSQDHDGSFCWGNVDNNPPECTGLERTEERVEIFTPWYVERKDRPVITKAPTSIGTAGQSFDIAIGGSQGMAVTRVLLMRAGSTTHSFDGDQRAIELTIVKNTASAVTVQSPFTSAAAPPGDYMLFALRRIATEGFKQWVPSVGVWTRVAPQSIKAVSPSIWKYVVMPCGGGGCLGWKKLDHRWKTIEIVAAGTHHGQRLYQLLSDGAVWRYLDIVCQDDTCSGWQQVDNNTKTTAIAAAGESLYELHNDGGIWRHTNLPCRDDICAGWERLGDDPKAIAIAAGNRRLYKLHNDGAVFMHADARCDTADCTRWVQLGSSGHTSAIAVSGRALYQLRGDGSVWQFTGTPCSGPTCTGWTPLDMSAKTVAIAAANTRVYKLHNDGSVWSYTGTPCTGERCPGWVRLGNDSKTTAISATGDGVYQLRNDGVVLRYTGAPCSGETCSGWERIGDDWRTTALVTSDPKTAAGSDPVYSLDSSPLYQIDDGSIWHYTGGECAGLECSAWKRVDNRGMAVEIAAHGRQLIQRRANGEIWRSQGGECNGSSCPPWELLDRNARTKAIATGGNQVFQLRSDGSILRYLGVPCTDAECSGWERLDANAKTVALAAAGTSLFQLHNDGAIWRFTGTPCRGERCPGWEPIDRNSRAKSIVAAGNQLFQLRSDGRLLRYLGTPCRGTTCSGWEVIGTNVKTRALAAGPTQLYQLQSDGRVLRFTGTGWESLDNNPTTVEIIAVGNTLYQRRADGRIWRYTGAPCAGESCTGWRVLGDIPNARRIAGGGLD